MFLLLKKNKGSSVFNTFNEEKTTSLACFFLNKTSDNKMPYLKLIKLMYLADRHMLDEHDKSITGDSYINMKLGPILNNTFFLIHQNEIDSYIHTEFPKNGSKYEINTIWQRHIQKKGYVISLKPSSENTKLNKNERKTAVLIQEKFGGQDQWDIVEYTKKKCAEWEDPSPYLTRDLPLRKILGALNKDNASILNIVLSA